MKAPVWTAVGILAVLGVLTAVAVPVVRASDWANTTLRAARSAVAEPVLAALPSTLSLRWSAPGIPPSSGAPVAGGTVVVASQHRIEGRDAATGATRWYYQRRNASLCAWTVQDGVVYAAFRKTAGCRDLTALDAGTGARRWYRNAELDVTITLTAMPGVLVAGSAHGLFAVDTGGSLNRWAFGRPSCRLSRPVLGSAGVAVLLTCARAPASVALLDLYTGKPRWLEPHTGKPRWLEPASGDLPAVLAVGPDVRVLAVTAGKPTITRLGPTGNRAGTLTAPTLAYADPDKLGATVYSGLIIGWVGTQLFAVREGTDRLLWTVSGTGPVATTPTGAVLAGANGFTELDPASGRTSRSIRTPAGAPARPTALARVGASVVTAGADGTRVYG
jgi:outer membrane protein assembly factor BamB